VLLLCYPGVPALYLTIPPESGCKRSVIQNHTVYCSPPCNTPFPVIYAPGRRKTGLQMRAAKICFQSYPLGLPLDLGGVGIPISSMTSSAILSISVNDGLASCNCPLNGLYVLKPHGRSFSLRRAFRSRKCVRCATSENA